MMLSFGSKSAWTPARLRVLLAFSMLMQVTAGFCQHLPPALEAGGYGLRFSNGGGFLQDLSLLSRLEGSRIAVSGSRPYQLAGVQNGTLLVNLTAPPGGFGLLLEHDRHGLITADRGLLAYSRKMTDDLAIGLGAAFDRWSARGYRSSGGLQVEAGIGLRLSPVVRAALRAGIPVQGDRPEQLRLGLGYEPGETWYGSFEVLKSMGLPAIVRFGFIYRPLLRLQVNAGFGTGGDSWWLGMGYTIGQARFDLFSSFHQQLGISPGVCVAWSVVRKTRRK